MAEEKRDIGREILNERREIKRREHGRVVNVPDVASVRNRTGLSQAKFAELLGRYPQVALRIGMPLVRH